MNTWRSCASRVYLLLSCNLWLFSAIDELGEGKACSKNVKHYKHYKHQKEPNTHYLIKNFCLSSKNNKKLVDSFLLLDGLVRSKMKDLNFVFENVIISDVDILKKIFFFQGRGLFCGIQVNVYDGSKRKFAGDIQNLLLKIADNKYYLDGAHVELVGKFNLSDEQIILLRYSSFLRDLVYDYVICIEKLVGLQIAPEKMISLFKPIQLKDLIGLGVVQSAKISEVNLNDIELKDNFLNYISYLILLDIANALLAKFQLTGITRYRVRTKKILYKKLKKEFLAQIQKGAPDTRTYFLQDGFASSGFSKVISELISIRLYTHCVIELINKV